MSPVEVAAGSAGPPQTCSTHSWVPPHSVSGTLGDIPWVGARVRVQPGAHVLIADQPAGIDVYGYDDFVSYAYAGGSAVEQISEAPPIP